MEASKDMQNYFDKIEEKVNKSKAIAEQARKKGFDPVDYVEVPLAKNMAERVEGLISVVAPQVKGSGIVERISELELEYGSQDWRVAFIVSLEVAQEKFCKFEDKREAMEVGMRVGLAYVTTATVASPLEGFVKLEIKKRKDEKEYFALFFSGPIRSAGTTATCVFVALCDYIRVNMGYDIYDPSENEIKRFSTELHDFHDRITNLQYLPSAEEIEFLTENLPIEIDGDPSEKLDVSNHKDLPRVATNKIRNGVCLVIGEGLTQKSKKFWGRFSKWNKEFGMEHWKFLEDFVNLQKRVQAKSKEEKKSDEKITKNYTYIKDIVAGRPVLGYPLEKGGFRIRYGRNRVSGLSSMSIHPLTMYVLENYIGTGTQLRYERPGKSTVVTPCDSMEGPIVRLKNGNVLFLEDEETTKKILKEIECILYLGDMLVDYGDFYVYAHSLVPVGYCEEWWIQELEKEGKNVENISILTDIDIKFLNKLIDEPIKTKVSIDKAFIISKKIGVPLHPRYTYHWNGINHKQFLSLMRWLNESVIDKEENKIILPLNYKLEKDYENIDPKNALELLGVPHKVVTKEYVVIQDEWAKAFMINLGFLEEDIDIKKIVEKVRERKDVLEIVNDISDVKLRDKDGIYIGSRMGRPEKAKERKLTGSPHILFPVGEEGGRLRSFQEALKLGKVNSDFPIFYCVKCNNETIYPRCEKCKEKTEKKYYCRECNKVLDNNKCEIHKYKENNNQEELILQSHKRKILDIQHYFDKSLEILGAKEYPALIKGVRGTSNEDHNPEPLFKGILRASHNIFVNKDGTTRFDMTELSMTHFKPKEIETSIAKLRNLGYKKDIYGMDLEDDEQILELKPQDLVLPGCDDGAEEGADEVLFRVGNFIDDLLVKVYGMDKFYGFKNKKDLVGHLVVGLAPHTSAGTVGRIIGFSKIQGLYANPMYHCAMRRDCDGDEACVMLLMDLFLNFSRKYLPGHRGARQDACLVLTSKLVPSEVDDMVFDMDLAWRYPLELYEAGLKWKMPWDIKIDQLKERLGTEKQYEGWGFTHDVTDINMGVRNSAYKKLPTMMEKVQGQMNLARKIRAVHTSEAAALVVERHFIRDIRGNLRKFSMQQFRCVGCNSKYRRPPLVGQCTKCGGKIIFTISEGSIIKYLEPSLQIAKEYNLPPYLQQTLDITKMRIESVFGKDKEKQEGLVKWFG